MFTDDVLTQRVLEHLRFGSTDYATNPNRGIKAQNTLMRFETS